MNSRTMSLPDLASEKKRNTCLSLSEGFAGADHEGSLAATRENWCPRPGTLLPGPGTGSDLGQVLPQYYRTRQFVLSTERAQRRVPQRLASELRFQEKALAKEIRAIHPLFFQRFDDLQLDRLLRAMSFLRLSSGRWVFGNESLNAQWPAPVGDRAFLLLSGRVALFPDPGGAGERVEVGRGAIFGEEKFSLGDESMQEFTAKAAHCEEPCIVAVMSTSVLESAFGDRAFGNTRIGQMWRHVPALGRIVKPDPALTKPGEANQEVAKYDPRATPKEPGQFVPLEEFASPHLTTAFHRYGTLPRPKKLKPGESRALGGASAAEANESNAVTHALSDISKIATAIHIMPTKEVLSEEPMSDYVLIVSKGGLEVRGDIRLTEKLDALPPKKVRLRIHIEKATNLAGDSIFDKLDPYCIVKLGDFKRFQTPVLWNVGPNPKFEYDGCLTYNDEKTLEFTVMDHDKFSADDLCGSGSIPIADLHDGWSGKVDLTRPKRGIFRSEEALEEPAGKVHITIKWDYEKINPLTRVPKTREWTDQQLFTLGEKDCWGTEELMLGPLFHRTLEQAANNMTYTLQLSNFRVLGLSEKGAAETITCWKAGRRRFMDFVKHCGRQNQFTQACRVSSLEKQSHIKELITRLINKWETEEQNTLMRKGLLDAPVVEEQMDPSRFRVAYRGVKAHITVRNALNLSGGGWFDKLDPYAILRFRGSKQEVRTRCLQDAGGDPVWDDEGTLTYNGEVALEMSVWDYDKYSADDLIATGVLQVEQFAGGFEGMVPLSLPGDKKKTMKQSMIIIGIQWDPPKDPNGIASGTQKALMR